MNLSWTRLPGSGSFILCSVYFLPDLHERYALLAFQWARKYGLRINLDLHTIPGSQNGRLGLNPSGNHFSFHPQALTTPGRMAKSIS